jgi:hypothetical protein
MSSRCNVLVLNMMPISPAQVDGVDGTTASGMPVHPYWGPTVELDVRIGSSRDSTVVYCTESDLPVLDTPQTRIDSNGFVRVGRYYAHDLILKPCGHQRAVYRVPDLRDISRLNLFALRITEDGSEPGLYSDPTEVVQYLPSGRFSVTGFTGTNHVQWSHPSLNEALLAREALLSVIGPIRLGRDVPPGAIKQRLVIADISQRKAVASEDGQLPLLVLASNDGVRPTGGLENE